MYLETEKSLMILLYSENHKRLATNRHTIPEQIIINHKKNSIFLYVINITSTKFFLFEIYT